MYEFDVSYVVSLYNKALMLPHVLRSLENQKGAFSIEYIFVDDASTDDSLAILRAETSDWRNITIIENADNAGPSVRVNQGARHARGRALCLFDADDVLPPDAVATMLDLMGRHDADIVHGKQVRGPGVPEGAARPIGPNPRHRVSDHPLDTMLGHGFVRMTWLVRKTLFERTSGMDERIFLQDEALRLRLGVHGRRLVDLRETVSYASEDSERRHSNPPQFHHDAFMAHYLFLMDNPSLVWKRKLRVNRKCLSIAWKSQRRKPINAFKLYVFILYISNPLWRMIDRGALKRIACYFQKIPGVRHHVPFKIGGE